MRRPRIEDKLRWFFTVLGVVALVLAGLSFLFTISRVGPGARVVTFSRLRYTEMTWRGGQMVRADGTPEPEGWSIKGTSRRGTTRTLGPGAVMTVRTHLELTPFVLPGLIAVGFWLAKMRRVPPGHCRECRYDLRGLPAAEGAARVCPECGAPDTTAATAGSPG